MSQPIRQLDTPQFPIDLDNLWLPDPQDLTPPTIHYSNVSQGLETCQDIDELLDVFGLPPTPPKFDDELLEFILTVEKETFYNYPAYPSPYPADGNSCSNESAPYTEPSLPCSQSTFPPEIDYYEAPVTAFTDEAATPDDSLSSESASPFSGPPSSLSPTTHSSKTNTFEIEQLKPYTAISPSPSCVPVASSSCASSVSSNQFAFPPDIKDRDAKKRYLNSLAAHRYRQKQKARNAARQATLARSLALYEGKRTAYEKSVEKFNVLKNMLLSMEENSQASIPILKPSSSSTDLHYAFPI